MILEVQIQNFGARRRTRVKVFIYQKIQGPQISIFVGENWPEASFYNKEQTQKYKFEIWVWKLFDFYPWKSGFFVFKENPPKKCFS